VSVLKTKMSKLLREFVTLNYDRNKILEFKAEKKPIIVSGILQRANAVNQNKRIYPKEILQREIDNYHKAVREGRATGELDHPESSVVNLSNVSHVVREIAWDGDDVVGKVEILNTPKGLIAQQLMESGIQLGISSRCVGETRKNNEGYDVVSEDLVLIAFDLVSEPSTQNAWLFKESRIIDLDEVRSKLPKVDRINRIANEILRGK
jgi:hypothetical protein